MTSRLARAVRRLHLFLDRVLGESDGGCRPVNNLRRWAPVDAVTDPLVVVNARHLDDLCELARALAAVGDPTDPLVHAIRGAIAQIRADAVHEPA